MTSKREPDTSVAETRPRGGWRRIRKIALWLVGIVVGLVLLAVILLPIVLSEARLKSMIADAGAEALNGREVSVGSVDLDVFSGVKLTDVRVANREGFSGDLVRVKEVDVRVKVWPAVLSFGKKLHATVSVVDPEILIERTADGKTNIEDLLEVKAEKESEKERKPSEPLALDALSLAFKVVGGRAVLRDKLGGVERTTTLRDLSVEAGMTAIDQPLVYRATGAVGDGRFEVSGEPRLFHGGVADPAQIRGELLKGTISKLPAGAVAAFLGLPPMVESVDGELRVAADQPGEIAAAGTLTASSPHEGVRFGATLSSTADLGKRDAHAKVTFGATPFSQGTFSFEIRDAGAKQMQAVGTFDLDLAKLTGGKAAKALGLPTTPDGAPAESQGKVTGRLEITGPLPRIKCVATGSIKGFQAHPSLTGGKALPAEDAEFRAEATLHLTAENQPDRLDIPVLEATSSFLQAKISNGRLASLADLKGLDADLAGTVRFSGREFNSRFGKALGLPVVHDKLTVTFLAKGDTGRANIAANAKLEREQGAPEPVEFAFSAQLDASGEKTKLSGINATAKAGGAAAPYAHGTLAGAVGDLTGTPNADLAFAGGIDLRRLAERFAPYAKVLADLDPSGQVTVRDGVLSGTADALHAGFKATARKVTVAAASGETPGVPKELADILSKEEFVSVCDVNADLTNNRVEIKALSIKSDMLTGSVTGAISDTAALQGALDVTFSAKTDAAGAVLAALGLLPKPIDTRGRIEFAAAVDTAAGRAELRTLKASTPYLVLGLKAPGVITGIDVVKLRKDPVAASKLLAGGVVLEGAVLLDALAKLPPGVLPPELKAGGRVPFSLKAGKASPMRVELSADATGAALTYGDLVTKPRGSAAKFALVAMLTDGVAVDIPNLEAVVDGAQMKLTGSLSEDLKTFTCKSLTATVADPAKLVAMVPALKDVSLSGRSDLSLSGTVPIEQVAAGDLSGIKFTGTADLREMRAAYAPMPKLAVAARGAVKLGSNAIDAGGLTLTASTLPEKRETTLTFKELRIVSAKKDAALLADPNALAVTFSAESARIDAGDLLKALPQKADAGAEEKTPEPAEKPAPPKENEAGFAFLKKHTVTGRIAVAELIYDKHVVSDIAAAFQLRDNRLSMQKPLTAAVHQGTVEANVTADLNDPLIAHGGKVRVRKIDINNAVSSMLPYKAVFEGKTGADLTWKGRGASLDDVRRAWTGGGEILIEDGVIANFKESPRWVADIAGFLTKHLGGDAFPDDKFSYGELKVTLKLAEGKVTSDDFVVGGKNGFNFKVSDAWGDLAGNVRASATVVAPTEFAMSYLSEKLKLAKRPQVEAVVKEKVAKLNPSFCSFNVARQDAKVQVVPKILIVGWASAVVKDVLTDPGSILKGILKDKLEERRTKEEDEKTGEEGGDLKEPGGENAKEEGGGDVKEETGAEEDDKKTKKEKKREKKAKKKKEREEAIKGILDGLLK